MSLMDAEVISLQSTKNTSPYTTLKQHIALYKAR